jgi:cation transport ATPase
MATNAEDSPRSLEVQRAQAEERRQRLEEQWYELEVKNSQREDRKHNLEEAKIVVDIFKHTITVISALFLILAYFGSQLIPPMTRPLFMGFSALEVMVWGLYLALCASFIGLVHSAVSPEPARTNPGIRMMLILVFSTLLIAVAIVVFSMVVLGQMP